VRRLAKELDDMKSIVSLLAMSPDRSTATNWASELEKNGFAHHTADEIKKALQVSLRTTEQSGAVAKDGQEVGENPGLLHHEDSMGTPGSDQFRPPPHSLNASSYDGSSRDER
jgi:hypothetical protein